MNRKSRLYINSSRLRDGEEESQRERDYEKVNADLTTSLEKEAALEMNLAKVARGSQEEAKKVKKLEAQLERLKEESSTAERTAAATQHGLES